MKRILFGSIAAIVILAAPMVAFMVRSDRSGTETVAAQATHPIAAHRTSTLYCEFNNFADQTPLVGFYFRVEGVQSVPVVLLLFQRERDGSQVDFGGQNVPSPHWVFDGSGSPATIRAPEGDMQINLYGYDPLKPGLVRGRPAQHPLQEPRWPLSPGCWSMRPAPSRAVAAKRVHEWVGPPSFLRSRAASAIARHLLVWVILTAGAKPVRAQSILDGSDATIGQEQAQAILASAGRALRSADPRVSELRRGRQGAICGAVEVRNRMGAYTGVRPFVYDPETRSFGRLPEDPELRNPASMADFTAMEQARTRYVQNCIDR